MQGPFSPILHEEAASGLEDCLGLREVVDHQETSGISVSPGYALLRREAMTEDEPVVGEGGYRDSAKTEDEYAPSLFDVLGWLRKGDQEVPAYKAPEQNDEVEEKADRTISEAHQAPLARDYVSGEGHPA